MQATDSPNVSSSTTLPEQHSVIETITFLASLISDPQAVDSKLDMLRSITSRLTSDETLSTQDQAKLIALQKELEDYLINHDPVRSFTKETLEQTLADHFNKPQRSTRKELGILLGSIILAYGICVVFTPASLSLVTRFLLPSPVVVSLLYGAIAWLFVSSRQNFKAEIRSVYNYFCGGITLGALGSIQFPLIFAFPHISAIPVFSYIGFVVPYFIMCIAFYLGAHLYARQLNVSRRLWSIPSVSAIGVVIGVIMLCLPHSTRVTSLFFYELSLLSIAIDVWLSIAATALSLRVAKHVTPRYRRSMWLFGMGQAAQGVGCTGFTTLLLISGPTPALGVGIGAIPYMVSAAFLLASAYTFKANSRA